MANITGTAIFQDHVRQLETTDPKHPSTWNPNYQTLIDNDTFLKVRSDTSGLIGSGFLPVAGGMSITRDGQGRISVVTYTGTPAGTQTVVYDDANGGRVNYVELILTAPITITVRETYSYDGTNQVTGSTRTVS